jgi:hypothetical protein
MKVLVACEFSGTVREAFKSRGHDAWSCDLLPTEIPGQHYQTSVFSSSIPAEWDLIIAHPPCTYLSNSGVCWLHKDPERWDKMRDGAEFLKEFLSNMRCKKVAIENPIMHKYAVEIIGRRQDQVIQPYQFGHLERKATCLWLKGLPKLWPTKNVYGEMMKLPKNVRERLHYLPPSATRQHERSRTYQGIAEAMADQWGSAA